MYLALAATIPGGRLSEERKRVEGVAVKSTLTCSLHDTREEERTQIKLYTPSVLVAAHHLHAAYTHSVIERVGDRLLPQMLPNCRAKERRRTAVPVDMVAAR